MNGTPEATVEAVKTDNNTVLNPSFQKKKDGRKAWVCKGVLVLVLVNDGSMETDRWFI